MWLALSSSSCLAPRSDASAAANAGHLVAQTITLVDEQGKPWLVLGPSHGYGGQGIQLLDDDGGTAIQLGVARSAEHRMPMIRLDSDGGDSWATLYAAEHGAHLGLGYGEGVSVSVNALPDGIEIYMDRNPADDLDAKPGNEAVRTEFQLSVGANKLMLTMPSKNGVRREIDLLELLR